jgi:hypothetical protein
MLTSDLPATVHVQREADCVVVTIGGNITDQADLEELAKLTAPRVVVDLENLIRFNSAGIVVWMKAIQSLCSASTTVEIHNAPHSFMHPYSMIRGFAATARIQSIVATYYCDRCDEPRLIKLNRRQHFPDGHLSLAYNPECKECSGLMAPDDPIFDMKIAL